MTSSSPRAVFFNPMKYYKKSDKAAMRQFTNALTKTAGRSLQ